MPGPFYTRDEDRRILLFLLENQQKKFVFQLDSVTDQDDWMICQHWRLLPTDWGVEWCGVYIPISYHAHMHTDRLYT